MCSIGVMGRRGGGGREIRGVIIQDFAAGRNLVVHSLCMCIAICECDPVGVLAVVVKLVRILVCVAQRASRAGSEQRMHHHVRINIA